MNSVSETCSKLKQEYDSCFNTWFTEKFLRGDNSNDVCGPLFQVYRDCVKKAIQEQKIDLNEIEREVMGTEDELKAPGS